ncbi:MAG TPA: GGDEF domain-containing protein [Sulfurovum sp.]|uniref:GGDEF domain-containing protein n=1 Tax=Sulfurovum sp. TaxID=1969726 RepID=UPI002F92ACD0
MRLNNFLSSGFKFGEEEHLLQFQFKMLNSIFVVVAFFSVLFGLLSDLGINDIGPVHSKVDYVYSFLTLVLIFLLRHSKKNYQLVIHSLLIISLFTFTSALIFVPQDEFRIIWFYLLIFVAYMLNGKRTGILYTAAAIGIILTSNYFLELHLSQTAINSGILGLIIGSFLSNVYTNKISEYENSLKQQNSTLSVLASTDYLTGITNKRMFNEIFKRYFQTAQKDGLRLTLLLLDLDHFKKINDTYGHQTGDKLLILFVQTIEKILAKSDIFARIGGEEFAILLSQMDNEEAYRLAEKIRQSVEDITIDHQGRSISLTTSIGISHDQNTDTSCDDMFSRADMALYKAKNEGRNKTCQ